MNAIKCTHIGRTLLLTNEYHQIGECLYSPFPLHVPVTKTDGDVTSNYIIVRLVRWWISKLTRYCVCCNKDHPSHAP